MRKGAAMRSERRLSHFAIITIAIAFLLLLYLFFPRVHTYSVSANTEIVFFTVNHPDGATSSLIEHAEIVDHLQVRTVRKARVHIKDGVAVNARRHGKDVLELQFEAPSNISIASRILLHDGSEISLESGLGIRLPLDENGVFMLAFDGSVTIGAHPGPRVDNLLLGGTVYIIERQILFKQRFLLDRLDLEPGCVVNFRSKNNTYKNQPDAAVLLRAASTGYGESRGIHVTANSAVESVEIIRYGAADYSIRSTMWARIKTDPLAQALIIIIVILSSLTTLIDFAHRYIIRRNDSNFGRGTGPE